jgi:hypothetical protein
MGGVAGTLDAVVAVPDHHAVLFENDRVRVLDARVGGDTVPLHTHRWPGVQYVVSFADFVRRDAASTAAAAVAGPGQSVDPPAGASAGISPAR